MNGGGPEQGLAVRVALGETEAEAGREIGVIVGIGPIEGIETEEAGAEIDKEEAGAEIEVEREIVRKEAGVGQQETEAGIEIAETGEVLPMTRVAQGMKGRTVTEVVMRN